MSGVRYRVVTFLGACFGALVALVPAGAGARTGADEIYQQTLRSTACVVASRGQTNTAATGWLVDRARRLLVTNHHVVDNTGTVSVLFPSPPGRPTEGESRLLRTDAHPLTGRVVATDRPRDLAVIELEALPRGATALPLAEDTSSPGERVYLLGNLNSSELLWRGDTGTVRKVTRKQLKDRQTGREIQALILEARTQVSPSPGYSGGPVVNEDGRLVGVATMVSAADNKLIWCIDVSEVRQVLQALKNPLHERTTSAARSTGE